ncbi:ABC transporter substrate-binding protein [Frisingicoccus sp.]|uniref:ABC transporter substrate-binding protein n=1 Tax=Frisingicoccus sp. TaxID=1918627 RepID=UPI002EBAEBB1|nr:ABC transporter substrate-binding protein [Frisingicoccus sp.]
MKKMTKVLSMALAAVMVIGSLTACGGSDAKETTAAADGEAVFTIGGIGPVTGDAASYGTSVKQGAEVAIKEINEAGGVVVGDTTYKLALVFEDDEATEDKAVQAYNAVMDQGAQAILGAVTSGACIAITDLTLEDGILQITPSGSAMDCAKNDNGFRMCFTDPAQGENMADLVVNTLGYKKIAVLWDNASDYSMGIKDAFEAKVAELGGEIVASESFATGDVDYNTQLTTIKATDAEVLFVPAYYQEVTYITKQAADMGINLPFVGSDGWDGILATVTDPATVEGAIFLSPFFAADPSENVTAFVSAYEEAYGATPDQFAADAYDTVYAIKASMETAGSVEGADMIAAMTEITVDGLTGTGITWTAEGEPNKGCKFIQIIDGAYTLYE